MTDPDFRAAKPKPRPSNPANGPFPDPEEPQATGVGISDPLQIMRHITYALRPLERGQRRLVLETLLEISE